MEQSLVEKLSNFVQIGENIKSSDDYDKWRARVTTFLAASVGPEAAEGFARLENTYWPDELALKLGHLEGVVAKETAAKEPQLAIPMTQTAFSAEIGTVRPDARKVFLVHGHDNEAKQTTARFLEKLDLDLIILHEQPSEGRTIIEKFESYSKDVAFAVVLLTPDDVGAANDDAGKLNKRARQNVIMELGYFMGKLGRNRVCALHRGGVELPSDYQGVLYIEMDEGGAWKTKIAQELVRANVRIDLHGLLET
jgi:predicted nucleotide-binding protein